MRGWSFHSVKGGVGKSTLSTLCALALARGHPDSPVYLVDLDLTGTSLADGLALDAPDFGLSTDAPLRWDLDPSGFLDHSAVPSRALARERALTDRHPVCGVPYLNDWLLHGGAEPCPTLRHIGWRLRGGPTNLTILPSSALPGDLQRTMPVVYDEEFSGFFESRLEHLLAEMAREAGDACVVVDVPPTIPGLSRAVLGVALRLSARPPIPLALDGFIPPPLDARRGGGLTWRAGLVTTLDLPDIRAMNRWLGKIRLEERRTVRVVVNRAPDPRPPWSEIFGGAPPTALQDAADFAPEDLLSREYSSPAPGTESFYEAMLDQAVWVQQDPRLSVFSGKPDFGAVHPAIQGLLGDLA